MEFTILGSSEMGCRLARDARFVMMDDLDDGTAIRNIVDPREHNELKASSGLEWYWHQLVYPRPRPCGKFDQTGNLYSVGTIAQPK